MIQLWCTRIGLHGEDDKKTTRATGTSTAATGSLCAVCHVPFVVFRVAFTVQMDWNRLYCCGGG